MSIHRIACASLKVFHNDSYKENTAWMIAIIQLQYNIIECCVKLLRFGFGWQQY
jgi:hypothetical protein